MDPTTAPAPWWTALLDVTGTPPTTGSGPAAALVGSYVVDDRALPDHDPAAGPVTLAVTGGAGQLAGPAALAGRRGVALRAVRVVLRDLDDLRGNARRVVAAVDAARADGSLDEATTVVVGLPDLEPGADWQGAVDEVATRELAVALPLVGTDGPPDPLRVAAWLEAAFDRETPVTALGGDPLCLLGAARRAFDGAGAVEVAAALSGRPAEALEGLDETALGGVRRWVLGVQCGADGPTRVAADLAGLGITQPSPET